MKCIRLMFSSHIKNVFNKMVVFFIFKKKKTYIYIKKCISLKILTKNLFTRLSEAIFEHNIDSYKIYVKTVAMLQLVKDIIYQLN